MRLTFLGGADEVGASGTLVEIGGKRLLVDAGIRISAKTRKGIADDQLPDLRLISEIGGPDYILVTHAHTDHTGALPLVVEQYPHVPVIATAPTIELVRVLQADAQRIMKTKQEQEGELPLFDQIASERLMNAFQPVEFKQSLRLGDRLQVTYYPSGHIVGAGSIVIDSDEGTLVMSGDLSLMTQRAVVRAEMPPVKADVLVLESTYGGKLHANRLAEEKRLVETLRAVIERGGKALIPAFALGRAQEVLQILLANRDQLDVPVYADGMVRAVCQAYSRFADYLPPSTVRAANNEPLFFRERIKPVFSALQRDELIHSASPCIIVASSGMLTGGPSALYARHLAGDPRNGIFLTGYQDEEAPGRFLQRMVRERQAGDEVVFQIDGQTVTVRCELGTYSLSAHADEGELVSVAEAFDPDEVALVHGDPAARHSIATRLRARQRIVRLPQSGGTLNYYYERKAWRIAELKRGSRADAVDVKALWEALKDKAGNYYSVRELAQAWWGDASRAAEIMEALQQDATYFAADWRQKDTFQVRTEAQVARLQRQRAIMLANPALVGKLVVLRDSNNRARVGVVQAAQETSFDVLLLGSKGRHFFADALLWVIGDWDGPHEGKQGINALNTVYKAARAIQDTLLPYEKRAKLVEAGKPINPSDLVPETLPEGVTPQVALLAVVLALAGDAATLEQDGLLPKRARENEPLEQNAARQVAYELFPPEARLRKVGVHLHRRQLALSFDFPERALEKYDEQIEAVSEATGWDVQVVRSINQQALGTAVYDLLPEGATIVKGPSFYPNTREVHVDIQNIENPAAMALAYLDLTGHRLFINTGKSTPEAAQSLTVGTPDARPAMEINATYALIRQALEPCGLSKTSLKNGQIVLTFISPQVGARYMDIISRLAEQTGYVITIHPHPDQNAIMQIVQRELRAVNWPIRKGPGIHVDRAEIAISVAVMPDEAELERVNGAIEKATGFRLAVRAAPVKT